LIVGTIALISKIPFRTIFFRSLVEIPFVVFALLMPFFGAGETINYFGFELYVEGLLAGAEIIAKGTIGVMMGVLLSATTSARSIIEGLARLRIPNPIIAIASFMIRYLNVVNDEVTRMRIARDSRGFEARGMRSWRVLAQSLGALFIRSYERGERVYLAMLSRGYRGQMPSESRTTKSNLSIAFILPIFAAAIAIFFGIIW
jgi:cobalt/nickel transport system permease protein